MKRKVETSPHFDSFLRFAAPLKQQLGINHFWYYQITDSGGYSYVGTHTAWSDYCFAESLLSRFPCLKHPSIINEGISLMKGGYKEVLDIAWQKFQINFNINLVSKTKNGMEAFGFATSFQDAGAEERLLNELPLLRLFIQAVRKKHKKLFEVLEENQVDLTEALGHIFTKPRQKFLCRATGKNC